MTKAGALRRSRTERRKNVPSATDGGLGARLRAERQEREWTLDEVSTRTGVARSTLSKIENGLMSPTYDILQKIATGMSLDLVNLFDSKPHSGILGRRSITRAGAGIVHPTEVYDYEFLAVEITNKAMLPFKTTIRARKKEEFDDWVRHPGEEFIYVLSGSLMLLTEFYAPELLNVGNSTYFDSQMGHMLLSVSEQDAEVIWMSTGVPPVWAQLPQVI